MPTDPICGMTVAEDSPRRFDRDGVTYFFCSDGCLSRFSEQAEGSLDDLPLPPSVEPPLTGYYCPMCEGVRSDVPGDCPRCGMALVAAGDGDEAEEARELAAMGRRLALAVALSTPVFILAMGPMLGLRIEQVIGAEVVQAACPFGAYDRVGLNALRRAGFQTVYTSDGGESKISDWLQTRNTIRQPDPVGQLRSLTETHESTMHRSARCIKNAIKRRL